jgi:UDP-glucose 4-epimerase
MQLLVTGATGKVGVNSHRAAALGPPVARRTCQGAVSQPLDPETDRIIKGSIDDCDCVDRAMRDVTHVVHLATTS